MYWSREDVSGSSSDRLRVPFALSMELITDYKGLQLPTASSPVKPYDQYWEVEIDVDRESNRLSILPMPQFLMNNPNINIIPTITINREPQGLPVSPSVSVVPVNNQETKCNDSEESKNSFKRKASITNLNNKSNIKPILSTPEFSKKIKERKVDTAFIDHTSSQESTNLDVNCNSDYNLIELSKLPSGITREYKFSSDGKLKVNHIISPKQDDEAKHNCECVSFKIGQKTMYVRPDCVKNFFSACSMVMRKKLTQEEIDTLLKHNSEFILPIPGYDSISRGISETKDVLMTNSKSNSVNQNDISNAKKKSTNQIRSRQVSPQPCTSKQANTSSKKRQTAKHNYSKLNVSNVQHSTVAGNKPGIRKTDVRHTIIEISDSDDDDALVVGIQKTDVSSTIIEISDSDDDNLDKQKLTARCKQMKTAIRKSQAPTKPTYVLASVSSALKKKGIPATKQKK